MKKTIVVATIATAALVSGCATRASGVAPVAVAATDYSGMQCVSARAELVTVRERVNALSRKQNNAATADAVGVFLLFIPAGSLFGGNVEGELAQAKGEQLALERHITTRCANEAAPASVIASN